jgi:8-oxo-dGTP pyrophosphatase MutT (NUDIX family)
MSLVDTLSRFHSLDPREENDRLRMVEFARKHANPFDRSIAEGHFTGSGLVISEDGRAVLLLFHTKLQRWLQPGGHGDLGEAEGEAVAAREVAEETGLMPRLHPGAPRPFDVDIHTIPARKADPQHEHLDLRYLFVASPSEAMRPEGSEGAPIPEGSASLRWFEVEEALAMDIDPGLKRMIRKARMIVAKP